MWVAKGPIGIQTPPQRWGFALRPLEVGPIWVLNIDDLGSDGELPYGGSAIESLSVSMRWFAASFECRPVWPIRRHPWCSRLYPGLGYSRIACLCTCTKFTLTHHCASRPPVPTTLFTFLVIDAPQLLSIGSRLIVCRFLSVPLSHCTFYRLQGGFCAIVMLGAVCGGRTRMCGWTR